MAIKRTCIVTNIIENGAGFAIREDNDEDCYIPAGLVKQLELEEMDEIVAIIAKNRSQPDQTPWFVIRAQVLEEVLD
jgi:hypothetical protein